MTLHYLAFHQHSSYTRQRPPAVPAVAPQVEKHPPGLLLPTPQPLSGSLANALLERRSTPALTGHPFSLQQLSSWLWHALGPSGGDTGLQRRTYPSAGGFFPVQVHLLVQHVPGLPRGIYRYDALSHSLLPTENQEGMDLNPLLQHPAMDTLPAVLLFTADLAQSTRKYGDRGYRFALQESGHMVQNLQLVATPLGLCTLPLGAFQDDVAQQLLGTEDPVLYGLLVGGVQDGLHLLEQPSPYLQYRLYTPEPFLLQQKLRALPRGRYWYMVKGDGGDHLRLRFQPDLRETVEQHLADWQAQGLVSRAWTTPYEPEEGLFGGANAMPLAHRFFELDAWLAVQAVGLGRTERNAVSHLWLTLLLQESGLDLFEQWDVWRKVARVRPAVRPEHQPVVDRVKGVLLQLRTLDQDGLWRQLQNLLPEASSLREDLQAWGAEFRTLPSRPDLERGLRSVLAAHVIFHWNRMMLSLTEQVLFTAAWGEATRPE